MRVAIGELKHEANTFVSRKITIEDFRTWHLWDGQQAIDGSRDTNVEMAGFLDVLEAEGVTPVPTLASFALSGGPLTAETYTELLERLLAGLEAARPFDAVLLALHGAMVTEVDDSADATMIEAVRALIGPDIPLVVTMDLHANVTARCAAGADAIVGFRTSPHIDLRDTGQRAARLLVRTLGGEIRPAMAFVKVPMVVPASTHMHQVPGPFKRLMDAAREVEGGDVLSASVFTVQPWMDITEFGFSTIAVTNGNVDLAEEVACRLAEQAWSERDAFLETRLVPPAEAIRRALARDDGPVVLSDLADGTGAGSPGDATAVIAALLEADPQGPALVCVRDPEVAEQVAAAGVGAEVDVHVGGKLDNVYNRPVRLRGTVEFAGPASFRFGGGGYTGVAMDMGLCVVVCQNNVHVLIVSNAVFTVDPAMYEAVGLQPAEARIVVVKSHIQFRAGYDGIAKEIILLDSPGMSSDHLESLDFRRIPRPIFPLDRETAFACP